MMASCGIKTRFLCQVRVELAGRRIAELGAGAESIEEEPGTE
jgi:hypothetical protein